jgi:hypothetical protein
VSVRATAHEASGSWVSLIELGEAEIKPGSLHCASPRVRRSEREEKAWARFGRDDNVFCFVG